jgi:hypothetical protein
MINDDGFSAILIRLLTLLKGKSLDIYHFDIKFQAIWVSWLLSTHG